MSTRKKANLFTSRSFNYNSCLFSFWSETCLRTFFMFFFSSDLLKPTRLLSRSAYQQDQLVLFTLTSLRTELLGNLPSLTSSRSPLQKALGSRPHWPSWVLEAGQRLSSSTVGSLIRNSSWAPPPSDTFTSCRLRTRAMLPASSCSDLLRTRTSRAGSSFPPISF